MDSILYEHIKLKVTCVLKAMRNSFLNVCLLYRMKENGRKVCFVRTSNMSVVKQALTIAKELPETVGRGMVFFPCLKYTSY